MPAATYNITIDQGATFTLPLTFQVPSSSANPTLIPMDLTGFNARSQIRDSLDAYYPLAEFTITFPPSGSTTGSVESSGSLVLSLTADQTAILPALRGVYDLELVQGTTVLRVLEGDCWIKRNVTR